MKTTFLKHLLFLILGLAFIGLVEVNATHIRAGEIIARRTSLDCSTATYVFDIIGYTDTGSTVEFGGGEINFGNGEPPIRVDTNFPTRFPLGEGVEVTIFTTNPVTFGPGVFTISFREFNRNAGVKNMANSVNTPFYIETQIKIDPSIGCNNSPILTVPPIDNAAKGVRFFHNPGAYDIDGDSLSYRLVVCKQDKDRPVANYEYPHIYDRRVFGAQAMREDQSGPSIFILDENNGNLIWDAPAGEGEYNVAFQVVEWRFINGRWREIGYVTRDMQILVEETTNNPPELTIPLDTCVVAGTVGNPTNLTAVITADDIDGGRVRIEAFGGPFELAQSPATYSPLPAIFQPVTAVLNFSWSPICGHVRDRPYEVTFKATDDGTHSHSAEQNDPNNARTQHNGGGAIRLSSFETWRISVIGPQPTGLTTQVQAGKQVQLNWDTYSCPNASLMQIWRRVESFDFDPDGCEVGIPANSGYSLIATIPIGTNSFLDNNLGQGLDFGANYCYRLVALFPLPTGGISYASDESCSLMEADGPVITHVDVNPFKTSQTNGEITIRWIPPVEADISILPPPYTYKIMRARGFDGDANLTVVAVTTDTFYIDQGLNTLDDVYNYRIHLYIAGENPDTQESSVKSARASSVRLGITELFKRLELDWEAKVPWSNQLQRAPYHYIYRDRVVANNPSQLVLIDSVNVTQDGFRYIDTGQFNNSELSNELEYCYYVSTVGGYGNPGIPLDTTINRSQRICAQPNDNVPPCPPFNVAIDNGFDCKQYLENKPCDFNDFFNILTWNRPAGDECFKDIRGYNVYYSDSGQPDSYQLLAELVRDTTYTDGNLPSFARCYRISSVDRSGNESELSEPICNDNCPFILFPNALTPNGDGRNDVFRPFYDNNSIPDFDVATCPRFVKSMVFRVFNRWGTEVYRYKSGGENTFLIDWEGVDQTGKPLSAGVYFYLAEVEFVVLNPANAKREYKGWVQILK